MISHKDRLDADYERLKHLERVTNELRESVQERATRAPRTFEEESQIISIRARTDEAYRAANRLGAPDPLPFERPNQFRARVLEDLSRYSPTYAGKGVGDLKDEGVLNIVEQRVLADAKAYGPAYGIAPTEIREIDKSTDKLHKVIEFVGGKDAWFGNAFRRQPRYGALRSRGDYENMTRNNLLSRITEIVPGWARTKVTGGRAAF